jgi:hypothetical protein
VKVPVVVDSKHAVALPGSATYRELIARNSLLDRARPKGILAIISNAMIGYPKLVVYF